MQEISRKNARIRCEHYSFKNLVVKSDKITNYGTKVLAQGVSVVV